MVNPINHYPIQGKRFSPRGLDPYYGGLVDRKAAQNLRAAEQAEVGPHEREANENQPQRKRISLACSRCRKRKIRCSGDDGNGQPCLNCKSSNKEHECHFLRVGAIARPEFEYNVVACRKNEPRVPSAYQPLPVAPNIYPENMVVPTIESSVYRSNPHYALAPRYVYPVSGWTGDYPDEDGAEYAVCQPSYTQQLNGPETQYVMPYRIVSTSASRQPLQAPAYSDPGMPFGYSGDTVSAPLMLRSPNPDAFPLGHAVGPDSVVDGSERLPLGLARRSLVGCGPSNYRAGSLSSAYSKSSQTTTTTTTTTSTSDAASPSSPVPPDLSASYAGYESVSPLSAFPLSVTSAVQPHIVPDSNVYSTSISPTSVPSTEVVLRTSASVPELSYRYDDTTIRLAKSGSTDCLYSGMELARPYHVLRSQKIKALASPRSDPGTASPEIRCKRSPSLSTCGIP